MKFFKEFHLEISQKAKKNYVILSCANYKKTFFSISIENFTFENIRIEYNRCK